MTAWHFSDGSVLESGGRVHGKASAAVYLRSALTYGHEVNVLPAPAGRVDVDPTSDYLLDVLAKSVAYALRQTLDTAYVPNVADAPPDVRAMIQGYKPGRPGLVY